MPPSSGSRPTRASGSPNVAPSAATMRSQPSTISKPRPTAWPFTRGITGTSRAGRRALHPADPRHVERLAQRDAAEAPRPRQPPVFEPARAATALHVGAGRERALACAGQQHATYVAIIFDLTPDLLQFALGDRVNGVEHVRPVDCDARDLVLQIVEDRHHSAAVARACETSASTSCVCCPSVAGGMRIVTGASPM